MCTTGITVAVTRGPDLGCITCTGTHIERSPSARFVFNETNEPNEIYSVRLRATPAVLSARKPGRGDDDDDRCGAIVHNRYALSCLFAGGYVGNGSRGSLPCLYAPHATARK